MTGQPPLEREPYNPYQPPKATLDVGDGFVPASDDGPFRPWRTMWLYPRRTIRQIVNRDATYGVLLLASLAGVAEALENASEQSRGDGMSLAVLLVACVAAGPLGGIFGVWLVAALLKWTGRWLRGVATTEHLRAAVAWGSLPTVAALLVWAVLVAVLGEELFTAATPRLDASSVRMAVFFGGSVAFGVLGGWALLLTVSAVAEVQHFRSAWRAVLNFVCVVAVLVVPVVLIVMLIAAMASV